LCLRSFVNIAVKCLQTQLDRISYVKSLNLSQQGHNRPCPTANSPQSIFEVKSFHSSTICYLVLPLPLMRLLTFSVPFLTLIVLSSSFIDHALNTRWANDQKNSILPEAAAIYATMNHGKGYVQEQAFAPRRIDTESNIEKVSSKEDEKSNVYCSETEQLF
jgi:hypothetical protein